MEELGPVYYLEIKSGKYIKKIHAHYMCIMFTRLVYMDESNRFANI